MMKRISHGPGPALVYCKIKADLERLRNILSAALPQVQLRFAASDSEAAPHLPEAQILYGWGFSGELLRKMPNLRWVQKMGAGVDDVIDAWPLHRDVLLTRTDGRLIARRMIEYVIGAILDRTARFPQGRQQQQQRVWHVYRPQTMANLCIGVAGLGEIGTEIARALRLFDARVIGWRRSEAPCEAVSEIYAGSARLPAFVAQCDVLVLVLPLTQESKNIFDAPILQRLPMGAHLINVGRGGVLDDQALLAAIDSGRVGHATLDVFETEPLPKGHPFWSNEHITITPHVCGPLLPEDVAAHFIENYAAFAQGRPLRNVINLARQY
jgi:glyoxylate/hydroxypyruvate reductase